jgi:omega-hydroxy-beta-dihydromenaquinone-9 sulfotransferase
MEDMRYGAQIASTVVHPPLFVLGVWRSGTTHLHNLLARDDRFAYPNNYEMLYPHTFLTTQATGRRLMQWMTPATRIMDNVKFGVDEPQEDEIALVASGLSFMLGLVVFPRNRNVYQKYRTLTDALPPEREQWKSALRQFLRKLTLKYNRPLILKSPAHTGRLDVLLEMFPAARFVHIHRDPYTVFQSSVHNWRKVKSFWGLVLRNVTG